MKPLILFSLKRRFLNKMTLIFMLILLVIGGCVCYIDKIVGILNHDLVQKISVSVELEHPHVFEELSSEVIEMNPSASIHIQQAGHHFLIQTPFPLEMSQKITLETVLTSYYHQTLPSEIQTVLTQYQRPMIEFQANQTTQNSSSNLFFIITTLYFMMISYTSLLANELVSEKMSNILELIGTQLTLKRYFYSKLLLGWLSILIQSSLSVVVLGVVFLSRYLFDQGHGLLQFLVKYHIFETPAKTLKELIKLWLGSHQNMILLLLSCLFLWIGIVLIQLVLFRITLRITSTEMASSVQNPLYIVLIVLYYVSVFMSSPSSLTSLLAKILACCPVTSMIFMPLRLLSIPTSALFWLTSLIINLTVLGFYLIKTQQVYLKHGLERCVQ